ncbi:MAG: 6-bladed beta-propeller [Treponema sp.]|jgi:DNA-binding beta-propeller fold protein YncE|nr:6-bladed beta-propeller [Treponema sp.]
MKKKILPVFFVCLIFTSPILFAQEGPGIPLPDDGADIATIRAREEFRIGVQAYYRYNFNEAIFSFERALNYRPGEALILDWLGRSYYRSGFEDTAIRVWQASAAAYGNNSGQGLLIRSKIETVRNRRSMLPVADDQVRYVESGRYPNKNGEYILYRQPSAVLSREDGTVWVVAYGSNEIIRIDVNGIIRDRKRGPLNGFDRPYDLVRGLDGKLFLSEFRGGRVSVLSSDGEWQYYIGSKGIGTGQLAGPQNLAVDEEGYLYVVDYGNRRISKFDPSGTFILSFGESGQGFEGFKSPTGIVARNGLIYAADNLTKCIYTFDRNGSYLGPLVREGLAGPESLRLLEDGRLLAADLNRILLIDPDTAIIRELGILGNSSRVRITGSDFDRNGNVLAADFKTGEITLMTRIEDMASGLFVQIERIISDEFPLVKVEFQVQDRLRRPVTGLDGRNFLLTEMGYPVAEQTFLGTSNLSNSSDIAILVERSPETLAARDELAAAVRDINASGARIVSLVSAGEQAVKENLAPAAGSSPARALEDAARGRASAYSLRWRFDAALRLAATELLSGEKKRAVAFVGKGSEILGPMAFEQYGLSELASYLANNGIVFYAILTGGPSPAELRYLCEETGGKVMQLYRSEGIVPELKKLVSKPSAYYSFSYRSSLDTDFGRAYLPLEIEAYLMERSGRDSTGYYPPLE